MDSSIEGARDWLIRPRHHHREEQTSRRTAHCLIVARLFFVFSHGLLAITASVSVGTATEADDSWWALFSPVWFGDALAAGSCIAACFASCPYIKLCLAERQARHGDHNPSILTEILPDIVWAIFGLLFVIIGTVGEVLFCRYLDGRRRRGAGDTGAAAAGLWPSILVSSIAAAMACCYGVCIRPNGEQLGLLGGAAFATAVAALFLPRGPTADDGWVLLIPSIVAAGGLAMFSCWRLQHCRRVLSREEALLRRAEQAVLLVVLLALLGLAAALNLGSTQLLGIAGGTAGAGVCATAALTARFSFLESRLSSVSERLMAAHAVPMEETESPSLASSRPLRQSSLSDATLSELLAGSSGGAGRPGSSNGFAAGPPSSDGSCIAVGIWSSSAVLEALADDGTPVPLDSPRAHTDGGFHDVPSGSSSSVAMRPTNGDKDLPPL